MNKTAKKILYIGISLIIIALLLLIYFEWEEIYSKKESNDIMKTILNNKDNNKNEDEIVIDDLKYIYVTCNIDPIENAEDEDDVKIPGWMIPSIKNLIIRNELSFMLGMSSDDSNNSTLSSVKPNGPQDKEK